MFNPFQKVQYLLIGPQLTVRGGETTPSKEGRKMPLPSKTLNKQHKTLFCKSNHHKLPCLFSVKSMAPSFVFEPPSDEEVELSEAEELEDEEEEAEGEGEEEKPSKRRQKQSPWDFASYSESVAEEHARRSTTSIDDKISRARQQHSTPLTEHADDASSSDSEPDKQVTS
jgi:ATP-dependent RNA helicase DDX27